MDSNADTRHPTPDIRIRLRNVRKQFGQRCGLAGVDLTLEGAGIVGVAGADGAGKTTLIRSLGGLLVIQADEASVLGYDLRADPTPMKAHIGYVPQAFSLHRDLSVLENLHFTARLNRLPRAETVRRIDELLARTALAPFADRAAGALSGGMKQKLAIANALLIQPSLLLLDEPTAGVDVMARGEIWALLERESARALVILSTSYLDEIASCDRLVYLADGRVVASGTPAALRAATPFDLYHAWGDDPRAIAHAARALPYVASARAAGRIARIEVTRTGSAGVARVLDDLRGLPGTLVEFAEQAPADMETMLLALSSANGPGKEIEGSRDPGIQGSSRDPIVVPRSLDPLISRSLPMIIRTTGLTKRFGDFTAVDALSIAVEPGTLFAFLGANGSGKSTTIRMLIGLLRPTSGSVEVDGIDVIREPRRVRDHVGYMGQKVSLYAGLSLRENVDFYAGLYGLSGNVLAQRWGALAERFDLRDAEREKAEALPAGVRQRAGLVLATLHQPRLLFLDEPTAGVDVHNRALFWEIIQDEAGRGVTVFVTTHFLEEVEYCDWVSFIDQGRLIANAPPETLRAEYADGYRIAIEAPEALRPPIAASLSAYADDIVRSSTGLHLRARSLDPQRLAEVDRRARSAGATAVHVEATPMTEVFRRILTARASPLPNGEVNLNGEKNLATDEHR